MTQIKKEIDMFKVELALSTEHSVRTEVNLV